jgi:mannan endo-1,4-beta-mannosidase
MSKEQPQAVLNSGTQKVNPSPTSIKLLVANSIPNPITTQLIVMLIIALVIVGGVYTYYRYTASESTCHSDGTFTCEQVLLNINTSSNTQGQNFILLKTQKSVGAISKISVNNLSESLKTCNSVYIDQEYLNASEYKIIKIILNCPNIDLTQISGSINIKYDLNNEEQSSTIEFFGENSNKQIEKAKNPETQKPTQIIENNTNTQTNNTNLQQNNTLPSNITITPSNITNQTTVRSGGGGGGGGSSGGSTPSAPTPDTTSPSLIITYSPSNPNSTQNITFTATANDTNGISQIKIYVNNTNVKNCATSPCNYTTNYYANGTIITYNAVANDTLNNINTTTTVNVTIVNPAIISPFVTVSGTKFYSNGSEFYFGGSNAYYLITYEKINPTLINYTLDSYAANNVTVARIWGHYDGEISACGYWSGDPAIQITPGVYNETNFQLLDSVVKKAKDRNIKLILTFTNFWGAHGGICAYSTWAGYPEDNSPNATSAAIFYENETVKGWYKDYIQTVLNRTNVYTGIKYKDEPTIMAWELMNEPRYPGTNGTPMRDWTRNIIQYIKSIDSNHLVSNGEEGFDVNSPTNYTQNYTNTYWMRVSDGTSFILNSQIPELDFLSLHLYPATFGMTNEIVDGVAYVKDHADIADMVGKPLILGEYGSDEEGSGDSSGKIDIYLAWWNISENRAAGDLLWEYVYDGTKCNEFGGNICDDRDVAILELYKRHNAIMKAKPANWSVESNAPTTSITSPSNGQNFTNYTINISGTTSDDMQVLYVKYKVNNGTWSTATGTTSWTGSAILKNGTNIIYAQAIDSSLNPSTTANVTITATLFGELDWIIFNDTLDPTWNDQSWSGTDNYTETSTVNNGTYSISFNNSAAWAALSIGRVGYATVPDPDGYSSIGFYIHGGGSSEYITMQLEGDGTFPSVVLGNTTNGWVYKRINMTDLNPYNNLFNRIDFTTQSPANNTFYIDDLTLIGRLIDIYNPNVTITSFTNNSVVTFNDTNSSYQVNGTSWDDNQVTYVKIRATNSTYNGTWVNATGTVNWTATILLYNGTNIIEAISVDLLGKNSTTYHANITATIPPDISPPNVNILNPTESQNYNTASIRVYGNASDTTGISYVQVRVKNSTYTGPWMNATGTITWRKDLDLSDGSNTIEAMAFDGYYNNATVNVNATYTNIGITFFTSTIINGTNTLHDNATVNVSFTNPTLTQFILNWNSANYSLYDDNLVFMINFDNMSALGENSSKVVDISKNANNGTVSGSSWYNSTGKYYGAYEFNGSSGAGKVAVGYKTVIPNGTQNRTVCAWAKTNSVTGGGTIIAWGTQSTNQTFSIGRDNANLLVDASSGSACYTNSFWSVDVWNHICAAYNGSDVILYTNGNLRSTNSRPMWNTGSAFFNIGVFTNFNYWNGTIDEIKIWNRTLDSTEITQIYASSLNKYSTSEWRFISLENTTTVGAYSFYASMTNATATVTTETRNFNRTSSDDGNVFTGNMISDIPYMDIDYTIPLIILACAVIILLLMHHIHVERKK